MLRAPSLSFLGACAHRDTRGSRFMLLSVLFCLSLSQLIFPFGFLPAHLFFLTYSVLWSLFPFGFF